MATTTPIINQSNEGLQQPPYPNFQIIRNVDLFVEFQYSIDYPNDLGDVSHFTLNGYTRYNYDLYFNANNNVKYLYFNEIQNRYVSNWYNENYPFVINNTETTGFEFSRSDNTGDDYFEMFDEEIGAYWLYNSEWFQYGFMNVIVEWLSTSEYRLLSTFNTPAEPYSIVGNSGTLGSWQKWNASFEQPRYSWYTNKYLYSYSWQNSIDNAIRNFSSYGEGYNNGYTKGNNDGKNDGYAEGYGEGYNDAINVDNQIYTIFNGILHVGLLPVNFFLMMFNFNILGINMAGLVSGLLSVAVVVIIIRLILGGKTESGGKK